MTEQPLRRRQRVALAVFTQPEILNDALLFPSGETVTEAEITSLLRPDGQKLYDQVWAQFAPAGSLGQP